MLYELKSTTQILFYSLKPVISKIIHHSQHNTEGKQKMTIELQNLNP